MRPFLLLACPLALSLAACTKQPGGSPADANGAATAVADGNGATKPSAAAEPPGGLPPPADVAAVPADARREPSGLASRVLTPPTGSEHPQLEDTVEVHYTGWTTDGKMFDSSVARGTPVRFPLNRVIKGWTEGVQLMAVGEKRRLWIPAELAYGTNPPAGAPAGMLVFDVELKSFTPAPKPIAAPTDVAQVPKDAKRTKSGLASRVLQKGRGGRHPAATDEVEVHYTGWTTDGKMFDSSVQRGHTATFPLNGVIKGWTEGVQLMTVGERRRLWIPAELAYGDQPGRPAGMLVFDIELVSIPSATKPAPATP